MDIENNFEKQFNWQEAIQYQDADAILSYWTQSSELQEEIAENLYLISNNSTASAIYNALLERFQSDDEIEKQNIIHAMDNLGARDLPTEIKTTDFLVDNFQEENSAQIVKALKNKVWRGSLPTKTPEENDKYQPIKDKAGLLFVDIIEGDYPKDLKLQAIAGIYQCAKSPELTDRINNDLQKIAVSGDEEESLFAIGEMISIKSSDRSFVAENINKKFDSGWFDLATQEEISKAITIIGWSNRPELRDYLLDLKIHPRFINDQKTQKNIEWALAKLQDKEKNES